MAQSPKFGSFDPTTVNGSVFGTFGVQYKPEEFERVREDGFTAMGMVPDCRIFIYGAEVTKDVVDVTVSNSIDGNTCDITLTNPRGRYEITKQDLMGKWREDKDILAAYDYTQFNRVTPGLFDNFMDKITSAAFGEKTATNIKKGMNIAKSVNALLGGSGGVPKVRGVTRQIFETKYFSGLFKNNGDIVFDYKDPVYVFFKGRFAPLWYFGFSGIITGWDDTDAYEQAYSIKIKCEDVLAYWKRSKLALRNSLYAYARGEDRNRSVQTTSAMRTTEEVGAFFNFSDLIKVAAYSFDYGQFAYNCHVSRPGRYLSTGASSNNFQGIDGTDVTNNSAYKDAVKKLQNEGFIDGGVSTIGGTGARYMFTRSKGGWGISVNGSATMGNKTKDLSGSAGTVNSSKNAGLIPISEIAYIHKTLFAQSKPYDLNGSPIGPSLSLYTQFNEIEFPEKVPFTGGNLKAMLDISIRYWEAESIIPTTVSSDSTTIKGTGWKDNKAFGIAGIHPALTYDFINNFSILDGIWQQCYKSKKSIDKLIMSPNDKIRSSVGGMPTELVSGDNKTIPAGTAFNFFRPRLFLILPRRFSDRYRKAEKGSYAKFENLFKQSQTSVYEFLKEKLKGVEYIMYASPCGDVFMEPELYDFHPLDFSQKIEQKNIITKEIPVKLRSYSGEKSLPATRQTKAYVFNPYANHPFFIMEKDRIRTSQTFNHQLIHTEILVQGGMTLGSGVLEFASDGFREWNTALSTGARARGYTVNTAFPDGTYIADGFQKNYDPGSVVQIALNKVTESNILLEKTAFSALMTNSSTLAILKVAKDYVTYMLKLKENNPMYPLFEVESGAVKGYIGETSKNLTDPATDTDAQVILNSMFPNLKEMSSRKVVDVVNVKYNRYSTESTKEFKKAAQTSGAFTKWGITASTYQNVMKAVMDASHNSAESDATIKELIKLGLGTETIITATDVAKVATDTVKLINEQKNAGATIALVRTLAEEKKAAQSGQYDPRMDMVKHYGYNPKDPIKNSFIKNGNEAYEYARVVFNRLLGKAFTISIDMIGRPEFLLNRPYYCERKDSIGLLTKYTLRYQMGSAFLSSATLEYVRKNKITFDYSLGDLDVFKGSVNNKYFKTQADYYYKLNKFATNFSNRTTDAIITAAQGSNPGFARSIGAKVAGNIASSVMGSMLPVGGVYSMHDRIGHMPFDTRFGDPGLSTTNATGLESKTEDKSVRVRDNDMAASLSQLVSDTIAERKTNEDNLTKLKTDYKKNEADVIKAKALQQEKKAELIQLFTVSPLDQVKVNSLVKEISAIGLEIIKKTGDVNSKEINIAKAKITVIENNKSLYGTETKPANVSDAVTSTYKSGQALNLPPYKDAELIRQGLFYKLFEAHIASQPGKVFTEWEVTEEKPIKLNFDGRGEVPYYIVKKQAARKGRTPFDAQDTILFPEDEGGLPPLV